ncbi:MAG: aldo/keto reductase, partial [Bacteroidetes bacterium]|nr:aldo/keto reductase [Bacteroidota bacterium]
ANAYVNERAVGRGIKASGVNRKDVFVSTKIWVSEYLNENIVEETLERLDLDYIDLLFIHQPSENYMNGYKIIEKAYKEGKVKSIGISNCERELDYILANCEIKPQVTQDEAHPYFTQEEYRKKIDAENIKLMSWYPLGHGDANLINEKIFKELGKKYSKSNAQIILRWHIQMGFIVIPGTSKVEHVKDNFNVLDFRLSDEEMNEIAKLNKNKRYYIRTDEMLKQFTKYIPTYESK